MWQACQSGLSGQNARRSAERGWSQRGAVLRVGVVGRSSAERAEREGWPGWPVPSEDGRAAERGTKPGWPGRRDCPYCGASARCTPSQLPEAPVSEGAEGGSECGWQKIQIRQEQAVINKPTTRPLAQPPTLPQPHPELISEPSEWAVVPPPRDGQWPSCAYVKGARFRSLK